MDKKLTLCGKALHVALSVGLFMFLGTALNAQGSQRKLSDEQISQLMSTDNSRISFIENKGQWPAHVLYRADVSGGQMLATPDGMLIGLFDRASLHAASEYGMKVEEIQTGKRPGMTIKDLGPAPSVKGFGWRLNFLGGTKAAPESIEREGESADYYNYLSGDPGTSAVGLHSYGVITYKDVYPGINVKYYTSPKGDLENDIVVKPGADAGKLNLMIEGIEELKTDADGALILPTTLGNVRIPSPVSYLVDANGQRTEISIKYRLTRKNSIGFDIPAYDKQKTLVIDPIVMRWATWIASNTNAAAHCHGVDLDASGNIYVVSRGGNGLVALGAFQTAYGGAGGADNLWLSKFVEPTTPGQSGTLVWQTYLGSTNTTNPYACTVGPDGYLYIDGVTNQNLNTSYGTGAPTQNWTQRAIVGGGGQQAFIAKVAPSGAWAVVRDVGSATTNLNPNLYDIRVLTTGTNTFELICAGYVTEQSGGTANGDIPEAQYPNGTAVTSGSGNTNGYILRITNDLDTIRWTKQYTSSGNTNEFFITVTDGSGNILVGGTTNGSSDISYTNLTQNTLTGSQDGWLMSLIPSTGNANWSRYFNSGSGKSTTILCMETNLQKSQFVIGGTTTGLSTANISTGAYQTTYPGSSSKDFFIASLPIAGTATTWGTYFGGNGNNGSDNMMGLNIDQNNDVYVLGYTNSKFTPTTIPAQEYPIQTDAYDGTDYDAIFFKLSGTTGDSLLFYTFLGGKSNEEDPIGERGIKFNSCRIYLAITSESNDFPLTTGTLDSVFSGSQGSVYLPVIVSMANPPDLADNGILTGGNQTITCGQAPQPITAAVPSYIIPAIIRNGVRQTNGTTAAYPDGLPQITSYQWQFSTNQGLTWTSIAGATGQNYTPGAIDSFTGVYEFRRIIDNDACNRAGDTLAVVKITVNPPYNPPTITTNSPLCSGQTLDLNTPAQSGYTFSWSGPNGFTSHAQDTTVANVTAASTGYYYLTVKNTSNGCPSYPDSSLVSITTALPAPGAGSNSPVCTGGTLSLTATGAGTNFSWTGPNGFTSSQADTTITNVTSANGGSYSVTQSNGGSCVSPATTVPVTVNPIAAPTNVNASPNPVCTGGTLTLTATGIAGDTLKWTFPGGGTATGSPVIRTGVTLAMAGNYSVLQTSPAGCISTSSIVGVTVSQTPSAPTLTAVPNPVCTGDTLTLTASGQGGATFTWTTPSGSHPTSNPLVINGVTTAAGGNYSVTQTATGCTSPSSANTNVMVNTTPVISSATGSNPTTCGGSEGSITLSGLISGQSYSVSYSFNNSGPISAGNITASGGQVVIPNLPAGSYTNIVVSLNGCASAPFSGTITLNPPATPLPPTVGSNSPVCSGNPLTLSATGQASATFTWKGPNGFTSSSPTPTVSNAAITALNGGNYCATQTVANCISDSACTIVTVDSTPQITTTDTAGPTTCGGTNGTITLNGLIPSQNYKVTYEEGTTSVTVNISANPSGQVIITGLNAGSYSNIVVEISGCSSSPVAGPIVLSDPANPPVPTVGSNTPVCAGNTIDLYGSGASGATFSWTGPLGFTSSVDSPSITGAAVNMSGSYCLVQTVAACLSQPACTPVLVNSLPVVSAGPSVILPSCSPTGVSIGGSPTASGGGGGFVYAWSPSGGLIPDSTVSNPTVQGITNTTTYTVSVTDANSCSASAQTVVNVTNNPPVVTIFPSGNTSWCAGSGGTVNLTAAVSGGSPAFNYTWTGVDISATNTRVVTTNPDIAGTYNYSVTVTDFYNCTTTATQTVTVDSLPTASAGPGAGFQDCIGSPVTIGGNPTASGGSGTYTYAWSGGAAAVANPAVSPTVNTRYTVTVTDGNTCTATAQTTVTVNSLPTANAGPPQSMPACSTVGVFIGGNPAASGGTAPYTYDWIPPTGLSSPDTSNPNVVGITATTGYTLVVTDSNGCQASDSTTVNITGSSSLSVIIIENTSLFWCQGASNGFVTLTAIPSNGVGPYGLRWFGADLSTDTGYYTTVNPSTVGVYLYSVEVTDATGCIAGSSLRVEVFPQVFANSGPAVDTVCSGQSITLGGNPTAIAGTPPYSYNWTGLASSNPNPTVIPVGASTYTVLVTDSNGCTATASTAVSLRTNPSANAGPDVTLSTCNSSGVSIGGAPTASGGGGGPYRYNWSPVTGLSSFDISNPTVQGITADSIYTVVVTDINGCSSSSDMEVLVVNRSPSVNVTSSGPTDWCTGSGTSVNLTANVTGGSLPFSYNWSGADLSPLNSSTGTANPSVQGSYVYDVTVTDVESCTATAGITLTVNPVPVANAGGRFIICNGDSVTLGGSPTASGGTPGYSYSWSGGAGITSNPVITPSSSGTYTVTVTDSKTCTAASSAVVTVRKSPVADAGISPISLPACSPSGVQLGGSPTGSSGSGGPFTFAWSPATGLSDSTASNPTVSGITVNTTYTVTVTDIAGCTATAQVTVKVTTAPPVVNITPGGVSEWCSGSTSSLTLTANVTGGSAPFGYSWSGTDLSPLNSAVTTAAPTLPASYTYVVTVTDAFNCTATATKTVIVDSLPSVSAGGGPNHEFPICSGSSVPIGGSPTASGGTPPYTYFWNPSTGLSSSIASNPIANPTASTTYTVTVTDMHSCTATAAATVVVRPNPVADAGGNKTLPTCSPTGITIGGSPTGSGGGGGPYTYLWTPSTGLSSDTAANPTVTGLTSTTLFTVVVTDVNSCTASSSAFISISSNGPSVSISASGPTEWCANSGASVNLTANVTNGPAVSFTWSGTDIAPLNSSVANANPGSPGSYVYTVSISDQNNCTASATETIIVDSLPLANAGASADICGGSTVVLGGNPTATEGTPPYLYAWSSGAAPVAAPSVNPQITTTYIVTVTDSHSCSATSVTTITVRPSPNANAGTPQTITTCPDDSVIIGGNPAANGGTSPYTYSWSPVTGLNFINVANPVVKGITSSQTYTLLVTDSNSCTSTSSVNVNVTPSTLQANPGGNKSVCFGPNNCVQLGGLPPVFGGYSPYTFSWNNPAGSVDDPASSNPVACPVTTTVYTVTITDSKGCTVTASQTVAVDPLFAANAGTDTSVCFGFPVVLGGSPSATGGTPSYTYAWSGGLAPVSNPTVNNINSSTFVLTITDAAGCQAVASVNITVNPNPSANAGNGGQLVACNADSLQLGGNPTASGGTVPYTYLWSPNAHLSCTSCSNPWVSQLGSTAGYTVVVTDSNGCSASSGATVTVKAPTLTAYAGGGGTFCQGSVTPTILGGNPTAAGGNGVYTYLWSPPTGLTSITVPNPIASPNATTHYDVVVTDGNGCVATDSVTITVNPKPTVSVGNAVSICSGGSTLLGGFPTGSGGTGTLTYAWSPGGGLSSATIANPNASPTTNTTYCVTVSDANSCSASACQSVTVNPAILACAGPTGGFSMTDCPGSYVQLGCNPTASGGSGNYGYAWSPDSVNGVQVLSGSNAPNPIVSGLSTTTVFTVTVTDNVTFCSATAQVNVTVNPSTLTANAGTDQNFCAGSTNCVTIGGNPTAVGSFPPFHYSWSNGLPAVANPCVTPASTTTISVTVTDRLSCSAVSSVTITVNPQIVVNAGNDTSVCSAQSLTLGGSPAATGGTGPGTYTYLWSPSGTLSANNTANPIAQNLTTNATYTLLVTDSLQCSASGSISVNVRPLPAANAGPGGDITPCAGDSIILGGNPTASGTVGPYTYLWGPPFNISLSCSTCSNPVVSNLGHTTLFSVVVTDSFGCQSVPSNALVTVVPNTVFANAVPPNLAPICLNGIGQCVTLGGNPPASGGFPGYTYSWSGGTVSNNTAPHPQACPVITTTYTLIVTDSRGCQAADSVTVVVNTPPTVTLTGLDTQYCVTAGNVFMTGTPAGGTFSGPGVTGNLFQPSVVGPGNWCLAYSYTNPGTGCSASTTVCVTVNALPVVSISGYSINGYCQSDSAFTLTGTPSGGTFSGTGIVGNQFNPATASVGANLITYTYTNASTGCSNSSQVTIHVTGNPTVSISAAVDTACEDQNVVITPSYSLDAFNIIWSKLGGGTIASGLNPIIVNPTGTNYCVVAEAVNTGGCVARDTTCIDVYLPPVITAPVVSNTCENQKDTINIIGSTTDPQGHTDVVSIIIPPAHGTLTSISNGIYVYVPAPYFHGRDTFEYGVCNSQCANTCDTGIATIAVCYVPIPPVIVDTTITIYENDTANVCPVVYDYNGLSLIIGNANCDTLYGTFSLTTDSCFDYIPSYNWVGTQIICVTVCDTAGLCDTATITIHVIDTIVKAVPIYCDMDSTLMNTPDTIHVLAVDTLHAADTTLSITTPPLNGRAGLGPDYTVIYTPDNGYKGTDEFVYELCGIAGNHKYCDTASVCVTVIDTASLCIIPDGFSPNGDGVNDVYVIPCNFYYPSATLQVFSRWGDEVWASNGPYQNNWDGKNQGGQVCPTGTYFIIYNYNDGVHKSVAQFVVLNR